MKQEISSNEPLKVQIINNNKILVNENLESTQTKGNFSADAIGNLQAKFIYDFDNFVTIPLRKDDKNYSCNVKVGNDDYSHNLIVIVTPQDDTYQYRITVLRTLKEVA